VIHVGGDEVNAEGFGSASSCADLQLDFEQLKQQFIGSVARRAARLGLAVQAWDDALAGSAERPQDARRWNDGKYGIFINAWNNNRRSNAFSYADAGYKVLSIRPPIHTLYIHELITRNAVKHIRGAYTVDDTLSSVTYRLFLLKHRLFSATF